MLAEHIRTYGPIHMLYCSLQFVPHVSHGKHQEGIATVWLVLFKAAACNILAKRLLFFKIC